VSKTPSKSFGFDGELMASFAENMQAGTQSACEGAEGKTPTKALVLMAN
jgi:hypothetical protein